MGKEEELVDAIKKGEIDLVKDILTTEDIDINKLDNNFQTPLIICCMTGNLKILKILLENNRIQVQKTNNFGYTALHYACQHDRIELVQELLHHHKSSLNQVTNEKKTCFYLACEFYCINTVKFLLTQDIDFNFPRNDGKTPFYTVCEKGYTALLLELLKYDFIDVNKPNNMASTPFMAACERGSLDILQPLLEHDEVLFNQVDDFGETGFMIACNLENTAVVLELLKYEKIQIDHQLLFRFACKKNYYAIVQQLLSEGKVQVNYKYKNDETPLYASAHNGHLRVVKILLNAPGIDLNLTGKYGETPFFVACYRGHLDIIELLLTYPQLDVNLPRDDQETPFYLACKLGNVDVVRILLNDNRVNVNKLTNDSKSPFWIACYYGYLSLVKWLLVSEREFIFSEEAESNPRALAKKKLHIQLSKLLDQYSEDKEDTLYRLKLELRFTESLVSDYLVCIHLVQKEVFRGNLKVLSKDSCKEEFVICNNRTKIEIQFEFSFFSGWLLFIFRVVDWLTLIDSGQEVYEITSTESSLTKQEEYSEPENEGVVNEKIDIGSARKKFLGKGISNDQQTEFTIVSQDEEITETPLQKFRRLKFEIQELEKELEEKKDYTEQHISSHELLSQAQNLKNQLSQVEQAKGNTLSEMEKTSQATTPAKIISQIKNVGAPYPQKAPQEQKSSKTESTGEVTYEVYVRSSNVQNLKEAELEERLAAIEQVLGISLESGKPNFQEGNLSKEVTLLEEKLKLLTPAQVDAIAKKFQHYSTEFQRATEQHKKQIVTVENEKRIESIFEKMEKWDQTTTLLPGLVQKLEKLKKLHQDAFQFVDSVNSISEGQQAILEQIKSQDKILKTAQENFALNNSTIQSNLESIDKRINELNKKIQLLQNKK